MKTFRNILLLIAVIPALTAISSRAADTITDIPEATTPEATTPKTTTLTAPQAEAQPTTAVQPEDYIDKPNTFYLRAGAGYTLNPTVDFVYIPRFNSKTFGMSIYGTHQSYFGKYRTISAQGNGIATTPAAETATQTTTLDWNDKDKYSGHNAFTTAGILGRTDWDTGFFTFDASYIGYANKGSDLKRNFDIGQAKLRIASRKEAWKYFFYDVSAAYLFGIDNARALENSSNPIPYSNGRSHLQEQDFSFATSLGPVFSPYSKLLFDINFDLARYNSYFDSYSGRFSIAPKYLFRRNRWFLNLGVKLSLLLHDDSSKWTSDAVTQSYSSSKMHSKNGQLIYPDVEIGFDIVRNYLNLYVKATGGAELNTYSSMVAQNPFLSLDYAWNYAGKELMNSTIENINARFGLQGNIASRLSYNLYGGYARYHSLPLDAVIDLRDYSSPDDLSWESSDLATTVSYANCNVYYATLDLGWHSTSITADGYLSYMHTDLNKTEATGFEPARFKGGFNIMYNWRKRIYIGLHGEGTSSRRGRFAVMSNVSETPIIDDGNEIIFPDPDETTTEDLTPATYKLASGGKCRLPGWFDLGISAEYRFNHAFSFWVYGSNLLNYTIQTAPLHTSAPVSITAGITITL